MNGQPANKNISGPSAAHFGGKTAPDSNSPLLPASFLSTPKKSWEPRGTIDDDVTSEQLNRSAIQRARFS